MKIKLMLILFMTNFLYASYYSSGNLTLKNNKKIIFEDDVLLEIKDGGIYINSKSNTQYLVDNNKAKQYKDSLFKRIVKKTKPDSPFQFEEIIKDVYIPTYNFAYILLKNISDDEFILKLKDGYALVAQKQDRESFSTKFGESEAYEIEYEIKKSFDSNMQEIDTKEEEIFKKVVSSNGELLAIDILDNGLKKVIKIEDEALAKFIDEKNKRIVEVKKFDFSTEKFYTTYLSKSNSSQKRLNVNYKMSKKNIKITTKSPVSLFDPENKSNSTIEHVGIIRDVRGELFELKKVQIVDGSIKVDWLNHPKKKVVILQFENEGTKDKKLLSKSKGQQFYSIEGTIYLASWMARNAINEKVFTFVNGSLPFDVTMKKVSAKTYEIQKSDNTIYKFILDDKNIVKTISYPSYDINIELESIDNDTTIKNKQYLEEFKTRNNIVLIKE